MKTRNLLAATLLASAAWILTGLSGTAHAATKTWNGSGCTPGNGGCLWSNAANWDGGIVPITGDDVVMPALTTPVGATGSTIDIPNLALNSLQISGYATSANGTMFLEASDPSGLTINGNVTFTPGPSAPSGTYNALLLSLGGKVQLGGDSVFTNTRPASTSGSSFDLGGHTLTITAPGYTAQTFSLAGPISGSGTLTINLPEKTALFMNPANTYSGTTNIDTVDYVTTLLETGSNDAKMFGSSTINIGAKARVLFRGNGAVTIDNPIFITPPATSGTFLANQIDFWANTANVSYTVPKITLLGNARLGVNDSSHSVTVNLAGINANGHCVQYGDDNNKAANFTSGPASCSVAVAGQEKNAPKTPNTGIRLITSNPIFVAIATLVSSAAFVYLARRTSYSIYRRRSR